MNSAVLQLLVLAGIAVFLILRLRSVLGTREGFEKPEAPDRMETRRRMPELEVIEGGPDHDITDHVAEDSSAAKALADMKRAEPSFSVSGFLQGARGAYEMILMGFERGELAEIKPYLDEEVYAAFAEVVEEREKQGLQIDATFVGLGDVSLVDATFDPDTRRGDVTIRFVGEMTSVVRDKGGDIVEGSPSEIKRQKDVWTFSRIMGDRDPNWILVATDA